LVVGFSVLMQMFGSGSRYFRRVYGQSKTAIGHA
jgi:hypothetical protein